MTTSRGNAPTTATTATRDADVWGPYSLLAPPPLSAFWLGRRCCIRSVHHAAFDYDVGKFVIIHEADHASRVACVYEDKPPTTRVTRTGSVAHSDPRCVQMLIAYHHLDPR